MAYWYPTQSRAASLAKELNTLERVAGEQALHATEVLPLISKMLVRAMDADGFPKHQIGQWIWVASQFRILAAAGDDGAGISGAALNFLGKRVEAGEIDADTVQDLNWILDSTVRRLSSGMRPEGVRSCLTADELIAVESRLAHLASVREFDADAIRQRVQQQVDELEALALEGRIGGAVAKVEALFKASSGAGKEGGAARAALLYLADEDDAVSDTGGVLGLLDDVYAIDWAYAVVESQTRCLPLLQVFLDQWPFVADLALTGVPPMPLDRFSQYIACACLNSLFAERKPDLLILRESAGFGGIAAFFAAVQCARLQGDGLEEEIGKLPTDQALIISDGVHHFRALFKGIETLGGKPKIRVGVSGVNASVTVDMGIAPYMSRSNTPHKALCSGTSLQIWQNNRHVDPLAALTGAGRRRLQRQNCVLLLGPRHKLEDYFSCLHPFGTSASALLGAKYVGADLTRHDLDHEASDTPFIYACSDPATALDLISNRPEHVSGWRVIVDGARTGRTLRASLQSSVEHADVPFCVIGELHEREATSDLLRSGMTVWYLEDHDVEPPPLVSPRPSDSDDVLTKSLRRIGGHWIQTTKIRSVQSDFLERAAACLGSRNSSEDEDSGAQALDYAVSAFIQRATSNPFRLPEIERRLGEEARKIASHASVLSLYDARAAGIESLFRQWSASAPPKTDRESEIVGLIESIPPSRSVVVICRSEQVAESCRAVAQAHPKLKTATWTNLERLRKSAPFDHVIVAGWLDRMSMRELADNGYAGRLELVLYPFEQRWFKSTLEASQKWARRLEEKTATSLGRLPAFSKLQTGRASLWRDQTEERLKAVSADPGDDAAEESDSPIFEQIEARAIAELQQRMQYGRDDHVTAAAQLVLFEEDGAYALLPPAGRVIVLADAQGPVDQSQLAGTDAERLLFRTVSTLEPGMVLAFAWGGDRDLLDARADQFIKDAAGVREAASAWKDALKRHLAPTMESYADFSRRMALEGQRRDPYTVRTWATHTNSIAPRNFRVLVPLIAKLTGDAHLQQDMTRVLASIDMIYRARAQAADAIVSELFSGEIDVNAGQLLFELNGTVIGYALHRVRSLAGVQDVPIELIGKIGLLCGVDAAHGGPDRIAAQ